MILDRPARRASRTRPAPESPEYRGKYRDDGKDDWLMRLGDHGRTVIMAVPPTAHAMSGIHHQHDPVDVKSLSDAIYSPPTSARERNRPEARKR
jgi:hypothetical protein